VGDVIELHSQQVRPEDNHELISDLARFAEGITRKRNGKSLARIQHSWKRSSWRKFAG
jgi:hypothetical protein